MKKISILFFLAVLMASCNPQKSSNEFTITGSVPDDITGKVYLQEYKNRKYIDLDSTEIANGKFTLTGSVAEPAIYILTPSQKSRRAQVFLDNNPLKVTLTNDWEIAGLEGSQNAEMFYTMLPASLKGTLNPDSLLLVNPASPVAVYFLNRNIYKYGYDELKSIREKLSASLNNHSYVQEIDDNLSSLENVQPGKTAPDFALQTASGDTLTLSSLRGKYVLIDFWASWCPDCRKASPRLVRLQNQYKDKNFTVLGVSIDENRESWLAAIEKDGMNWPQVISEGGWNSHELKAYAVRWLPTSFLVDPQGVIVDKNIEVTKLEPPTCGATQLI
ncbi:MAG: TlpA disulfide reductase family protein [Bacteroidia bacterium]|nr:TlpA disulfide reductase family protein [Bacteroidia bacterium]